MNIINIKTEKRLIGDKGEDASVKFLKKKRYKILERNYDHKNGEIDIIAMDKGTVVFAEVKTRSYGNDSSFESRPAASVTPEKQRRLIRTASHYILTKLKDNTPVRFDVIEVILKESEIGEEFLINHIENAFDLNSAYGNTVH